MRNARNMITVAKGVIIIVLFTIISFFLSISGDMYFQGLGGVYNLILPPLLGIAGIFIFLLTCWASKNEKLRTLIIILVSSYLIYSGVFFHLKSGYLPIPFN